MSKQPFSIVCASVLLLAAPVSHVFAGSTEDADRQFLNKLESGAAAQTAPQPAPAQPASPPVTFRSSAPVTTATEPEPTSPPPATVSNASTPAEQAPVAKATKPRAMSQGQDVIAQRSADSVKAVKRTHEQRVVEQGQQPAEVAAMDPGMPTADSVKAVKRVREERVVVQGQQPGEVAMDPGPPISTTTTTTTPTRMTTTRVIVVDPQPAADHDHDHDRDHHGFFHRLFSHVQNNHPEDW